MTEPMPPHQPYPTAPPSRPGELQPSRAADVAVAWILWALLLLGCIGTWLVMVVVGLAVGLQCTSESARDQVCSGSAADVAQAGYYGTWVVMALAVLGSLVLTIVATVRRRLAWVWPAGAIGVVVLSFVVWSVAYEQVA